MIGNNGFIIGAWLNAWNAVKNTLGVEFTANRDVSGGYPSLSGFALKLKNTAGTLTNTLSNTTTAVRSWVMPDKDGTVAMISDLVDASASVRGLVNTTTQTLAGQKTFSSAVISDGNILIGHGNGSNTAANLNIGDGTGNANTTGYQIINIGSQSGRVNQTGYNIVNLGAYAGYWNQSGHSLINIGYSAGSSNISGISSTCIGAFSGYQMLSSNNTFIGSFAGYQITSTGNNSIIGNWQGFAGMVSSVGFAAGSTLMLFIDSAGRLALNGITAPSYNFSLSGQAAKTIGLERNTTANTAGNVLTIVASGATPGSADKNGGTAIITGGVSTGTGQSGVQLKGYVAGASGTADNTSVIGVEVLGNKLGFYTATPITKPTITGSRASGAALQDLLTKLASLGLITDGTSA